MVLLSLASLFASTLLFYYTLRFYNLMSDTKLQDALKLLLNGFLLLVLKSLVGICEDYGYINMPFPKGDLEGLVSLIAYIVIIFSMLKFRRVFVEFEVQKKAISMLRNVFENPGKQSAPAAEKPKAAAKRRKNN
ncbi:MAG: hypothetical protein ABIG96_04990 [Candidatus Micrarchaeota archaeon]